jgi:hypothetical protein
MFGRNSLAFYWPRQQKHSFPLTGGICKFYAVLFDHLLFLLLGICMTPATSPSTFIFGQLFSNIG